MFTIKKAAQVWLCLGALVLIAVIYLANKAQPEQYFLERVVKITQKNGSCSGEQVRTASGKDYILTAGHCVKLVVNGIATIETEDGRTLHRKFIAEDIHSDLLLLEGLDNLEGLHIASGRRKNQHVRTFTHGNAFDTYETSGVLIQDLRVEIPWNIPKAECARMPKFKWTVFEFVEMCALQVMETVTTAMVMPGSSGGAVVNDDGQLIGVVSALEDRLGMLVRLSDIQDFLRNY